MQNYLSKGKELLRLIINNGFEGFFVGEAVRNTIMQIDYKRVDIITNASLDDLMRIYASFTNELIDDETLRVHYFDYDFFFQTFTQNKNKFKIDNRSTLSNHYAKSLLDDLATKNFTINAIAMSYSGKVTDAYNGCTDIKAKRIRTIANPKQRFTTHPIDILNALSLRANLKFAISKNTFTQIRKRSKLLTGVSSDEVFDVLKEIVEGPYAKKAIIDIAKTKTYKYLPSLSKGLVRLANRYKKVTIEELLLMCFVANGQVDNRYTSKIQNFETFMKAFNLALANKKGVYDKFSLFSNGLDVCVEANYINYLLGKSYLKTKSIKREFETLPIKKACDLAFKGEEILRITGINDTVMISDIIDEIVAMILNGEIRNNYDQIKDVAIRILNEKGINYNLDRKQDISVITGEKHIDDLDLVNKVIEKDYSVVNNKVDQMLEDDTSFRMSYDRPSVDEVNQTDEFDDPRLKALEQRIDEQDRILQERTQRLNELERMQKLESTNKLVKSTIDQIKQDSALCDQIQDFDDFEFEYRKFIVEYLDKQKGER